MSLLRLRVVFFDLDDTLFDHRYAARCAVECLPASHPCLRDVPLSQIESVNHEVLEEIHLRVLAGTIDVDEARIERMARIVGAFGGSVSDAEAGVIADRYRRAYSASRRSVPGAAALLQHMREAGLAVGVVTNNMVDEQVKKLEDLQLTHLVDELIVSEAVGAWKPDRRIFDFALDRFKVRADEAVMIGDSWTSDVEGALGVGIPPVWYNPEGKARPDSDVSRRNRKRHVVEISALEPTETIAERILSVEPQP